MKCVGRNGLNSAVVMVLVFIGQVFAEMPADNFNDNLMADIWELYADDAAHCWITEANQRLEVHATDGADDEAEYVSNGWALDVGTDFRLKVDFHYSRIGWEDASVFIWLSHMATGSPQYVFLSAGCEDNQPYYYYETVIDGSIVNEAWETRHADRGTFYLSYDSSVDELYLSFSGYGSANAWKTARNLLQDQWGNSLVSVGIGGESYGAQLSSGQAYLDNFAIESGNILGPDTGLIYVDEKAVGNGDGSSWADAYTDLQNALEEAESGDEIQVAAGTYDSSAELGGVGERYKAFQISLLEDSLLRLNDSIVTCNISGEGTVEIPAGSKVVISGNAVISTSRTFVEGNLHIVETAQILDSEMHLGVSAILTTSDKAVVADNWIQSASPSYLGIDSAAFNGSISGNTIELTVGAFHSGRALEICGLDQQGGGEPATVGLDSVPGQNQATWTLGRLELDADTALTLVSAQDNQAPFDRGREQEVLYVNELILGDGAVLDVGAHRLYYNQDNLVLGQDAEILVNQVIPSRSLNLLAFDDLDEFVNRIEASRPVAVELIRDDPLDPVGLMVVHSTTEPILVKGQFDPTRAGRLLVKFDYAAGPDARASVYVSESPVLGSADRIAVDSFRGTGSQRLHLFESWVDVSTLDLSRGCWVELEIWVARGLNQLQLLNDQRRLYGIGAGNDVWINDWLVEEHCDDTVCRDVTLDQAVRWEDFWVAKAAMGRYAGLGGADVVSRCFEGAFCADGYVDKYDQFSMDWTVGYAEAVCGPLALTPYSPGVLQGNTGPRRLFGLGDLNPPAGLMLLGKGSLSRSDADFKDYLYHLGTGQSEALRYDYTNVQVVTSPGKQVHIVSSERGLVKLNGESLLVPARRPYADSIMSYGIHWQGPSPSGLPLLDACVTLKSLYVAPVVVNPDGEVPYVAAARLSSDGSVVEQIYHDVAWFNPERFTKPDRYYGLREIELDEQGNLYALSVYRVQDCTMLWKYDSQGAVLAKSSGEELGIEDPLALCYCPVDQQLYVASGLLTAGSPNQSVVYQLAVEADGFGVAREIVIPDMHHVTSMCADAEGVLWVAGFSLTEEIPAKVYANTGMEYGPRLARIDLSRDSVESIDITGAVGEIGFPTSIVWVEE